MHIYLFYNFSFIIKKVEIKDLLLYKEKNEIKGDEKIIKCDLHGFRLFDAIEEIINIIEGCLSSGDNILYIIHGYRNGQVLKNYFHSQEFLEDMKVEGYKLKEMNIPNPGVSIFKIVFPNNLK